MSNDVALPGDRVPSTFLNAAPHQTVPAETGIFSLDLNAILRILTHWRWLIAGTAAAGLLAGLAHALLTKPMYRAGVTLEANPPSVEILDEKRRGSDPTVGNWDYITTQVGLLQSQAVAERVAQDLNLATNKQFVPGDGDPKVRLKVAAAKVAAGLKVIAPEQGSIISFSFDGETPTIAAQVANGIADGFIASGLQRKYDASNYARNFLQQQLGKTRGELERGERQLVAYAQSQGIINTGSAVGANPGDTSSLPGASLIALNEALATATARRIESQGAYQQAQLSGDSADVTAGTAPLRQSKAALEAEYQDKLTLLKPDHPDMLSLKARMTEIERQIGREQSKVASAKNTSLLAQYRAAAAAENSLRNQVAGLKSAVLDLRGRSIQYNILQRDVDTNRALYDALLQRYKEIGIGAGVGTSPISIVDRAQPPGGPFKPNLPYDLIVGFALGLLCGIAAAMLLEFLNDTIKTREDVRTKLRVACLGVVPRQRGKSALVDDLEDTKSEVSEAYSAVQAALRFSSEGGAPKAIFLTSANPGEGKSTSALALSRNYARRGDRVLLIDADLRRPTFRGESKGKGLTTLLTSEDSIRPNVLPTQYENMWLLPCGPIAPNPADLLAGKRFGVILAEACEHFDRVVVDGPPMLGLADASFLCAFIGHVMVVVESGRTRTRLARDTIERIHNAGAHLLGVTITKSLEEASRYGYAAYRYSEVEGRKTETIMLARHEDA